MGRFSLVDGRYSVKEVTEETRKVSRKQACGHGSHVSHNSIRILHSPTYFSCEQRSLYNYLDVGSLFDYFICSL
jgi:hypothetical protein